MKYLLSILLVLALFSTGCSQSDEEKVSQSMTDNNKMQETKMKDTNMDMQDTKYQKPSDEEL